jgi:FkbM family methyltransferase
VRFLQIGANDGVLNDPIRNLVIQHRLPGLLVEPLPDIFARLQENYAGQPGITFEQCAVGEVDGDSTLYRVRPDPGLPDWLRGIASFDRNHLTSRKFGFPDLERHVEPVKIAVLTLPSLLNKHGIAEVDLLQIDTEGHDCHIVRSAIQAGLRPAIINYEFIHTRPDDRAACKRLLADHGYSFIDVGRDTLAVLDA